MKLGNWNSLLWSYLEEAHCPGAPLYLCFSTAVLQEILNTEFSTSLTPAEAEDHFLKACNSLVRIYGVKAWLPEVVFTSSGVNKTFCLSYAVQQILVAERMFADERYTASAYFPRYRSVLGIDDLGGSMPIGYDQFDRIWSTLKNEILSLPGSSEKTVTFKKGKGNNLNRNLPISQALLSYENLSRIYGEIKHIGSYDDHSLLLQVQRKKHILLKDGQSKIFNRYLREPLADQIRNFASTYSKKSGSIVTVRKNRDLITPDYFEVFRNFEGWDEFLQLCLRNDTNGDLVGILQKYFLRNKVLILVKGFAGEFVGVELPTAISTGEKFIIVAEDSYSQFVFHNLIECTETSTIERLTFPEISIPKGFTLFYCSPVFAKGLDVIIGKAGYFTESNSVVQQFLFIGGIPLKHRSNEYLLGYPPFEISYAGKMLTPQAEINVNAEIVKVKTLFQQLKQCTSEKKYLIKYLDSDVVLSLTQVRNNYGDSDIGYVIDNKGHIGPTASLGLGSCEVFFKHFNIYGLPLYDERFNRKSDKEMNYREFMLAPDSYIPLRRSEVLTLIERLIEIVPISKIKFVRNRILITKAVPPRVYRQFCNLSCT